METVIPPDRTAGHVIQKYNFKVLVAAKDESDEAVEQNVAEALKQTEEQKENIEVQTAESQENLSESASSKDEMIEELLKKADELSSNLVKMQMQLEKQQDEFSNQLKEAKETSFEEGKMAGISECETKYKNEIDELRSRLSHTIAVLDQSRDGFLKKIDTIEEDLIEAALDLAKEVINKEIDKNSKDIALRLSKLLLEEIKDATKITLKVNPEDYEYIKNSLEDVTKIEVISDPAVGLGGVVIISDSGNIDAQILSRFNRIKETLFGVH